MIGVSTGDPGGALVSDRLFIRDASIKASRGEDAEFSFSQVEPVAVFGRVAALEALKQPAGPWRRERPGKAMWRRVC